MKTNQVLGIFVAIFVSILGWAGLTIVDHGERISTSENNEQHIIKKLDKMDLKLDRVLER